MASTVPPCCLQLSHGINLDTCLHFLTLLYSRDASASNIYKAHDSTPNAQGGRSPSSGSSLHSPAYPPYSPSGAWAAPQLPLPSLISRRGVVEAKRCAEAGSAPIWRTAVAGKQGAEGTETCVTSSPAPPGHAHSLEGTPRPWLQIGVAVKDGETAARGNFLPLKRTQTSILSLVG